MMSRWIELVSIDSGRPSRRRAKWLSEADNSATRIADLSANSRRASARSRVAKTLYDSRILSITRAWNERISARPSGEKA